MSHFSLKTFIRKSPLSAIRGYFQSRTLLSDYDWASPSDSQKITEAIMALGDIGESVLCDFERIHELANEVGISQIIEQSRSPLFRLDIAGQIAEMGHHEAAFYVFVNHPNLFHWTLEMLYVDSLTTSSWKTCLAGPNLQYSDSAEIRTHLGKAIAEYYHQQGRGRRCLVDYYYRINPDRHCFFAYPENYATEDLVYEDRDHLTRRIRRPVMEVIFIYQPDSGMLSVHARGDKFAKALQEIFCQAILELDGIPDANTQVYDLSVLKDPVFRFVTDPADPIESVMLKMVEFHLPELLGRKITVAANPGAGSEQTVFNMIDQVVSGFHVNRDRLYVKRAKITVKFRSSPGQKGKSVTFFVSSPNGCTLHDVPHHHIIKKYLGRWGFVTTLLNREDAA